MALEPLKLKMSRTAFFDAIDDLTELRRKKVKSYVAAHLRLIRSYNEALDWAEAVWNTPDQLASAAQSIDRLRRTLDDNAEKISKLLALSDESQSANLCISSLKKLSKDAFARYKEIREQIDKTNLRRRMFRNKASVEDTAAINWAIVIRNIQAASALWKKHRGIPKGSDRFQFAKLLVGIFASGDSRMWKSVETAMEVYDQLARKGNPKEIVEALPPTYSRNPGQIPIHERIEPKFDLSRLLQHRLADVLDSGNNDTLTRFGGDEAELFVPSPEAMENRMGGDGTLFEKKHHIKVQEEEEKEKEAKAPKHGSSKVPGDKPTLKEQPSKKSPEPEPSEEELQEAEEPLDQDEENFEENEEQEE